MAVFTRSTLILFAFLAAAGCKTGDERAEEFYQSALALLASGDNERAVVEFQNVFQHNGQHEQARRALADLLLEQGETSRAYGQYLRLVEQYPDTPEVRVILAQVALENGQWDEAERHGNAAIEMIPEDPAARALDAALTYRDAVAAQDEEAMSAAAATAAELLAADPQDDVSRRVVIDDLLRSDTPYDAMAEIDAGLDLDPENYAYNTLRLQLLIQVQNMGSVGTQLQRMVELYPEDEDLAQTLISWYLSQGDVEGARNFLRQLAGGDTAAPEGHITVVQLIQATQGPEAARSELDRLAQVNADNSNADIYTALSAVIGFEAGERDAAIATIESILDGAEPTEQTLRIRNILARFYIATDNQVGARAQVETILEADASNVDALKMRAAWAIEDDRPDDAILDLRAALGQAPRDAEILTLMAQAYERSGSTALAGERLAQAVTVSNAGAPESLRYAAFLQREGRDAAAIATLTDARTADPGNVDVLAALASQFLSQQNWVQAQDIADALRSLDTPRAQETATGVQAAILLGQDRVQESVDLLQAAIDSENVGSSAVVQIAQIQMRAGEVDAARATLDEALAEAPDDPNLRMARATLSAVEGDLEDAEAQFRALIEAEPQAEGPVLQLYNLLVSTDRQEDAQALIQASLEAQPQAMNLMWIRASELERTGDIDGAIALYEQMYDINSGSVTVANNLASLLASHRDDADSLARATSIAARLRDIESAPIQDTYGWIAYRNGNYDDARDYLEPAAEELSEDPLVQYHLGMTYAALGLNDAAREVLTLALDIAGDSDLPQFTTARETLDGLDG